MMAMALKKKKKMEKPSYATHQDPEGSREDYNKGQHSCSQVKEVLKAFHKK